MTRTAKIAWYQSHCYHGVFVAAAESAAPAFDVVPVPPRRVFAILACGLAGAPRLVDATRWPAPRTVPYPRPEWAIRYGDTRKWQRDDHDDPWSPTLDRRWPR